MFVSKITSMLVSKVSRTFWRRLVANMATIGTQLSRIEPNSAIISPKFQTLADGVAVAGNSRPKGIKPVEMIEV